MLHKVLLSTSVLFAATFFSTEAAVYDNAPDASRNLAAAREWSDGLTEAGEAEYRQKFGSNAPRMPSPEYWGDLPVYQIFPDRFNNGNQNNDLVNVRSFQSSQRRSRQYYDVYQYRHGGDLQGIIDRLDYIQKLGSGVIYLNPVFYNANADYHMYCVTNPVRVDPGMGTLSDLQTLVREAHERGIRVILDFVVNHVCEPSTYYSRRPTNRDACLKGRYQNSVQGTTGVVSGQGTLRFGSRFFGPLKHTKMYSKCGPGLGENFEYAQFGDFTGTMIDFNGNDPDLRYILTNMAKYWIASTDIDGFRLDAIKHVTESFIAYFNVHVRDYALSVGKDDFFIVGELLGPDWWLQRFNGNMNLDPNHPEYADTGIVHPGTRDVIVSLKPLYQREGQKQRFPGCSSVYDLGHSHNTRDAFRKTGGDIGGYLRSRNIAGSDLNLLYHFVDNHDMDRFLQSKTDDYRRKNSGWMTVAQAYLLGSVGVPVTYYGDEQGFNGNCQFSSISVGSRADSRVKSLCDDRLGGNWDTTFRQTMWEGAGFNLGSSLDSVNDLARISYPLGVNRVPWQQDPFLQENIIFNMVRRMSKLRRTCRPLARGFQYFRPSGGEGIMAVSRIWYDQEAVVIINTTPNTLNVPDILVDYGINPPYQSFRYRNMFSQNEASDGWTEGRHNGVHLKLNGRFYLGGYQVAVLVRADHINYNWDSDVGVFTCKDGEAGPQFAVVKSRLVASGGKSNQSDLITATIGGVGGAFLVLGAALVARKQYKKPKVDAFKEYEVESNQVTSFSSSSDPKSKTNVADTGSKWVKWQPTE